MGVGRRHTVSGKKQLSYVADGGTLIRVVLVHGAALVGDEMNVAGPIRIVSHEDSVKVGVPIRVHFGDSTKKGRVQVARVACSIAIARGNDARVYTSRIGLPGIQVQASSSLASADINVLAVC